MKVYTKDHTWMELSGNELCIGITEYGGSELGQIVYADLPEVGREIRKGETLCTLESTKTVHEVPCPIDGRITKVASPNEADGLFYELINSNPESVAICHIGLTAGMLPLVGDYLSLLEYAEKCLSKRDYFWALDAMAYHDIRLNKIKEAIRKKRETADEQ